MLRGTNRYPEPAQGGACPLPERFNGDEGGRLVVRHVSEEAHEVVRASARCSPHRELSHAMQPSLSDRVSHRTTVTPSLFRDADVPTLFQQEEDACHDSGAPTTV